MTVGIATQVVASALYLLPVIVVVLARSRRRAPLDELSLWVPATVAFDLLTTVLVAGSCPWISQL